MFRRKHICLLILVAFVLGYKFAPRLPLISLRTSKATRNTTGATGLTPTAQINESQNLLSKESSSKTNQDKTENWETEREQLEQEFERRKTHLAQMCQRLIIEPASRINLGDVDTTLCQAIRRDYGNYLFILIQRKLVA